MSKAVSEQNKASGVSGSPGLPDIPCGSIDAPCPSSSHVGSEDDLYAAAKAAENG